LVISSSLGIHRLKEWFYFYTYYIIRQVKTVNSGQKLNRLISLVHHRWNLPVLAELHKRHGARFVVLVNALGVGRASLSSSLSDLEELGFVRRNTGHGHPMRPEYLLSDAGEAIGEDCEKLLRIVQRRNELDLAFRKWTLPLVATLGDDVKRFSEVRTELDLVTPRSISPRAITLGLKGLQAHRWAKRSLIDDYPPTAGYELQPKGQVILGCLGGLLQGTA